MKILLAIMLATLFVLGVRERFGHAQPQGVALLSVRDAKPGNCLRWNKNDSGVHWGSCLGDCIHKVPGGRMESYSGQCVGADTKVEP